MFDTARPYILNKGISLGLPLAFLLLLHIWYPFSSPILWWSVVIFAHTLGYGHFVLGFYYQLTALTKRQAWKRLGALAGLFAVATLGSWYMIATGQLAYFSIFAVGYFILHGVLNEHTIMLRQLPHAPPAKYFLPFTLFLIPFVFLAMPHPSFFFTPQFVFLNPTPQFALRYLFTQVISLPVFNIIIFTAWGGFILLVPVRLMFDRQPRTGFSILLATLITIWLGLQFAPLNYAIIYFFLLSYHFISFSVFYYQRYQAAQPARLPAYIRDHLIVFTPFILLSLAAFYHVGHGFSIHQTVFNGEIFITLSMIHITTSLLNETWFCRLCQL